MSLTIVKAQTAHAAAEAVISRIEKDGRQIVIAPDAFTLAVEQTISAALGQKSLFDIEVMSFARFASVYLGEKEQDCLSPAGSVMLMEKVIRREEASLTHYKRAVRKPDFASEIFAAITSIRNSGVTPADLHAIEDKLGGYVGQKTREIAHLYEKYLVELETHYSDGTSRLEALVRAIRERGDLGDVSFYVVDHVDLNKKQLDVVAALVEQAKSVTVAVSDAAGALNERIYPPLRDRLLCAIGGTPAEITVPSNLTGTKKVLANELFAYAFEKNERTVDDLFLWEAKDIEEEVTLLATEIICHVRKFGRRYADNAVITPSFEKYLPVVTKVFRRYGIPFFADRRVPLIESPLFRHVMLAMELSQKGYDRLSVKKYVLHELFPATREEKEAFCDYIDKSGDDHDSFKKPFELFRDDPLYEVAERVRVSLMEEIRVFDDHPATATVGEYVDRLIEYLRLNDYDAKVEAFLSSIIRAGLLEEAEFLRQTPAAIISLIDELSRLRRDEMIEFADFLSALKAGAAQVKIATLPVSLDCVYFAPVQQAMYAPIHALYVLGADDGLFPLEKVGEGILGTIEYDAWQRNNVMILHTGIEELKESRFHAVQLLLRGDLTYLSHVESVPCSPIFTQITELFKIKPKKCSDVLSLYGIDVLIPTKAVAVDALVEYSRREHEGGLSERERIFSTVLPPLDTGETFPIPVKSDLPVILSGVKPFFRSGMTNISALESYFTCPFEHFVKHGLGAREKNPVSFKSNDVGNLIHECMERFVQEIIAIANRKGDRDSSLSDRIEKVITDQMVQVCVDRIVDALFDKPKYKAIVKALGTRALSRARRSCQVVAKRVRDHLILTDYVPTFFEVFFPSRRQDECDKIPDPHRLPPLETVQIGGVRLMGKIDRIDLRKADDRLLTVIYDYKTGSANITANELYVGKKIQLPIYLAVLEASGYTPVATLYFALSDRKKAKEEQILHGPKLNDPVFLPLEVKHVDRTISAAASIYTGVSSVKVEREDGEEEEVLSEKEGMLLNESSFRAQWEYAVLIAERAIEEIRQGYIFPTPLKSGREAHCAYCSAKNICHHAEEYIRLEVKIDPEGICRIVENAMQRTESEETEE